GRLEEDQAVLRVGEVEAPAVAFAGDAEDVLLGLPAEQRELEPPLALEGAVTRAHVAAHAAQEAHDVTLEIDLVERLSGGELDFRVSGARREETDGARER